MVNVKKCIKKMGKKENCAKEKKVNLISHKFDKQVNKKNSFFNSAEKNKNGRFPT